MNIDITELMKTGLFELHYMRQGDSEEWSIIPAQTSGFKLFGGTFDASDFKIGDYPQDAEEWAKNMEVDDKWFTDIYNPTESLDGSWEDDIPWDKIPYEYDWVAMDEDGRWFGFQYPPEIITDEQEWGEDSGEFEKLKDSDMPTPPHWTESLVRRPQ